MATNIERTVNVGTAIGIAVLGADSFHKFLPSVQDVRGAQPDDRQIRADVHAGELVAGITIVTVGYLASAIAGNALPMVVGGVSFLAMCATYEWLLRTPNPFGG